MGFALGELLDVTVGAMLGIALGLSPRRKDG